MVIDTRYRILWYVGVLSVWMASCKTPVEEPRIAVEQPANFPPVHYDLQKNPVTNEGFALGKALFYENKISRDGTINCGSCHQQSAAFTHKGHMVSHGIDDKLGKRNSPGIMNLAWQPDFFWDGGVHDLDLQPIVPIENPVEMDEKLGNVLTKLRADPKYVDKFKAAFGSDQINTERFLKALSQFMVTLVSAMTVMCVTKVILYLNKSWQDYTCLNKTVPPAMRALCLPILVFVTMDLIKLVKQIWVAP